MPKSAPVALDNHRADTARTASANPASRKAGNAPDDADAPVEHPPRRRKRSNKQVTLTAAVALLVLAVAGSGGWYLLQVDDNEQAATPGSPGTKAGPAGKAAKASKAPEKERKPPVFLPLDAFTVNLQQEGSERYLQTVIVLEASDEKAVELIKAQMPIIRGRILLLLSSKYPSELGSLAGKELLADEIVSEARKNVHFKAPDQQLSRAHFNTFVIQ